MTEEIGARFNRLKVAMESGRKACEDKDYHALRGHLAEVESHQLALQEEGHSYSELMAHIRDAGGKPADEELLEWHGLVDEAGFKVHVVTSDGLMFGGRELAATPACGE